MSSSSATSWTSVTDRASIKHIVLGDGRYLGLQGSFVAPVGGTYTFEVYSQPFAGSSLSDLFADLIFENDYIGWKKDVFTHIPVLYKHYRYRFQTRTNDDRNMLELQIKVAIPPDGGLEVLTSAHADTCFENGCKVTSYLQAHACNPSPSARFGPSAARSSSNAHRASALPGQSEAQSPSAFGPTRPVNPRQIVRIEGRAARSRD
jgi:hypothetical protein